MSIDSKLSDIVKNESETEWEIRRDLELGEKIVGRNKERLNLLEKKYHLFCKKGGSQS